MNHRRSSVSQHRTGFREGPRSVLDYEKFIGHEGSELRFHIESPGAGHFHVLSKEEILLRLERLPKYVQCNLNMIVLPRMTRKRKLMDIYGLQWDRTIYLYPMNDDLRHDMGRYISPLYRIEALKYGGSIIEGADENVIQWTPESIHHYYLENILIHEIGHTFDIKNMRAADREAFAEDFVCKFGDRGLRRKHVKSAS